MSHVDAPKGSRLGIPMHEENFISCVEYDKTSGGPRTRHVFGSGGRGCHSLQKPNGMSSESSHHRDDASDFGLFVHRIHNTCDHFDGVLSIYKNIGCKWPLSQYSRKMRASAKKYLRQ